MIRSGILQFSMHWCWQKQLGATKQVFDTVQFVVQLRMKHAFELLRWAMLWFENGLNAELDERGLPDQYVAGIDDLHRLSPEELRNKLARLEKRDSLQRLFHSSEVRQIRARIDQEWASVLGNSKKEDVYSYAMSFDGKHWHISYKNEKDFVENSKGANYVAQLLERNDKAIPCYILHESSEFTLTKNDPTISKNDAIEELNLLRVQLGKMRQQMEQKPHEVLPEDRNEEQEILSRISQLTGLSGRPKQKGSANSARTAVNKAIKRFYLTCRDKKLNEFVDHLKANLQIGGNPVYCGNLKWKIISSEAKLHDVTRNVTP